MQKINGSVTGVSAKQKGDIVQGYGKIKHNYHVDNFFELEYWEEATEQECIDSFNNLITKQRLCKS